MFDDNILHICANLIWNINLYKGMTLQTWVSNQFLLNFWEFMRMEGKWILKEALSVFQTIS